VTRTIVGPWPARPSLLVRTLRRVINRLDPVNAEPFRIRVAERNTIEFSNGTELPLEEVDRILQPYREGR
jgi:hypothetical protein